MKEKTFLHLHRKDVSFTLGGGSDEHPFSIHSASIGTSWTARGWRYVASILMALMLCVGNMWGAGETISSLTPASNALGKSYPQPGKRYYVYAQNKNTESDYANQVVFWARATPGSSTKYYQIQQTAPVTDGKVPAAAIIVQIVVENNKPYITTAIDGETEPRLFFQKGATKYLIAQRDAKKDANTTYYEPQWSFTYSNYTYQIKGVSLNGETETWCEVRAKYASGKQNFNTSQTALAYAANNSTAPDWTKWKFVEVPSTWYYSSTPSKSGYASATVEVSKDGTNWSSSIATTSTTSEQIHLYFRASAAPSGYDFLGWYDGDVLKSTDLTYDATVSGTGTSDNPTTFNYVAKYRPWQTVYYKLKGVVATGQEERGSVQVSLDGESWQDSPNGEVVGSVVTSAAKPQITVYFKGVPSGDSYALSSFGYADVYSTISRVTKIGNSSFIFDPSTGVTEAVFEIKNANNHLSEANACLIDLKATFGKKAVYKGTVARTTGSPANGCTVKVAFTQDGLASATTQTEVGSVALAEDETSKNRAIFFEASVDNTDPNRYRFNGWYDNASATGDALSTNLSYNKGFAVQFGNTVEQNTFTLYGDFSESTKKYYRAIAAASPNVGTVKAGFSDDLTSASATANASAYNFNESFERTAYFEAILPPSGYEFRGWSTTSDEADIIEGARSLTYHESFAVSSTNSDEPTIIKRYAIFRAVDAQEVQMWDADDTSLGKGDFADAIANSNVAKIKLLRSVTLANSATITAPATIDLDGFDINGTTIAINPGEGKEVKFINTDSHGYGKVNLNTEANGISVTNGNLILDGAEIIVIGSGENTYGIVVGSGAKLTLISSYVRVSALSTVYGLIVNGTASLEGGTINASSTNSFAVQTNAGSETSISGSAELIGTVNALKHTGGDVSIIGGGFRGGEQDITYADANKIALQGGYFVHNAGLSELLSSSYMVDDVIPAGLAFDPEIYNYSVIKSSDYPKAVIVWATGNVKNRMGFSTIESALDYAKNHAGDNISRAILMRADATLEAGYYTIPANATLVVPYSAEQTDAMPYIRRVSTNDVPESAYRTLTLKQGAHIEVYGAIEVGGLQTTGNIDAAGVNGISRPGGLTYGLLDMKSGSSITMNNGSNFYAWGFVIGDGTIDVRRGAVVKEQFQIMDWKGFTPTALMAVGGSVDYTLHVLPVNQYFIQNVEVKTTYRPGSRLKAQVSACVQGLSLAFNDIGIIGIRYSDEDKAAGKVDDIAIFLLDNNDDSEDTWVRKSYDVANDVQLYEVSNSAYLGSLKMDIDVSNSGVQFGGIDVQDLNVDSRDFVLPLANNFKIHLLNGTLVVTQNTALLPGAVMEINKKATMTITDRVYTYTGGYWYTSPQTLYIYDKDQWGTYVFDSKPVDNYIMGYGARIRYRHGGLQKERTLTPEGLGHGKLIVHGTVDVKGYLKTTNGDKTATPVITHPDKGSDYVSGVTETTHSPSTGGASITSTIADAGTITLSRNAGNVTSSGHSSYIWQVNEISSTGTPSYFGNHAIPAWLTNEAGSAYGAGDGYTETAGTTAGKSFCFIDIDGDAKGEWVSLTDDGCFVYDNNDVYYAKPQAYVALANGKTENADHTYTSADGEKTLILIEDNCQWWEVEPVAGHPDVFHCKHPLNDTYYTYSEEDDTWVEKKFKIEWQNWDASPVKYMPLVGEDSINYYMLPYGSHPQWLSENPTRKKDAYYTYDFIGWSPEITESTIVTGDIVYTAQYQQNDRLYTITFEDASHNAIANQYLKMGAIPTDPTGVDMTNKEWSPALGAVTGNATYTLVTKNTAGPFDISFVNWNGDVLKKANGTDDAIYSIELTEPLTVPVYDGEDPTKPALTDEAYEFIGWKTVSGDTVLIGDDLPGADANATYMAAFSKGTPKYTITWANIDGNSGSTTSQVEYGQVPVYGGTPTKSGSTFVGWDPAISAVTGNTTYTAQFLENRTIDDAQTISTHTEVSTITVETTGALTVNNKTLTAENLILKSSGDASGQLIPTGSKPKFNVTNAYYDLNLNIDGRHWFAFGVPWVVNLDVTPLTEVESGRTLVLGRDYEIVYYNGAKRATQGAGAHCWEKVADGTHILQPGRGYMIAFAGHINTVRFAKATGTPVIFNGTVSVDANNGATDNVNGGWNAIANPMAYHVTMNAGPTTGYVHDGGVIGSDGYVPYDINDKKYVVGKMVYVQVGGSQSVVINPAGDKGAITPASAPARRTKATDKQYLSLNDYYQVSIADANEQGGSVYVLPEENKEDKYVIGHDLSHLGISDQKAQIWVFRYGTKLALNTTAPIDDVAEYALRVYAPKNGEYTITNNQSPVSDDEYVVYLTRNGEAIWNLSDGAYTTDLTSGVHTEYGLRLSARKTPAVVTGIDEAIVDANGETRKVLINNQVFIIRGNEVYTIDGQMVK